MPPSCRKGAMMAEPPADERKPASLYFGGVTSSNTFERGVWSLAVDAGWLPFQTSSVVEPRPRWKGAFARIDSSSVVLFGGSDSGDYFDDTWVLRVSRGSALPFKHRELTRTQSKTGTEG